MNRIEASLQEVYTKKFKCSMTELKRSALNFSDKAEWNEALGVYEADPFPTQYLLTSAWVLFRLEQRYMGDRVDGAEVLFPTFMAPDEMVLFKEALKYGLSRLSGVELNERIAGLLWAAVQYAEYVPRGT